MFSYVSYPETCMITCSLWYVYLAVARQWWFQFDRSLIECQEKKFNYINIHCRWVVFMMFSDHKIRKTPVCGVALISNWLITPLFFRIFSKGIHKSMSNYCCEVFESRIPLTNNITFLDSKMAGESAQCFKILNFPYGIPSWEQILCTSYR